MKGLKLQTEAQIKGQKAQSDAEIAAARATSEHVLKQQKQDTEAALEQFRIAAGMQDKREQRDADAVTEAAWMATDKATKAHTAVISAAGKVQAAKVTAQHRPKSPSGGRR
jgi:hypothetical protein